MEGRGGVEEGVLWGEEGGGAELCRAHDVGLELLKLLQVGRLKRRVQEGRGGSTWG